MRRDARADRVRALVAGGATVAAAAAEVGVNQSSAYRYLQVRAAWWAGREGSAHGGWA